MTSLKDHGLPRFPRGDRGRSVEAMAVYLVETYLSRRGARGPGLAPGARRRAADEVTRDGLDVRHLRSVFVPADETCFHLFDAVSAAAVLAAGERAAIDLDRVSKATDGAEPTRRRNTT
jgi:hypothetical protein